MVSYGLRDLLIKIIKNDKYNEFQEMLKNKKNYKYVCSCNTDDQRD
jgi:hypothetical protein